jgi:hypothetical protein|tara:strand:+ start:176 stop:541 length:366 start_codon:yes stop_codon:yes gene_type:complete
MKYERELIATVAVDSGTLMIGDPCYALRFKQKDYDAMIEELCGACSQGKPECKHSYAKPLKSPLYKGIDERVTFTTGFGDGLYEVYQTTADFGQDGKRVTKVEIILITDEEIAEWQEEVKK